MKIPNFKDLSQTMSFNLSLIAGLFVVFIITIYDVMTILINRLWCILISLGFDNLWFTCEPFNFNEFIYKTFLTVILLFFLFQTLNHYQGLDKVREELDVLKNKKKSKK